MITRHLFITKLSPFYSPIWQNSKRVSSLSPYPATPQYHYLFHIYGSMERLKLDCSTPIKSTSFTETLKDVIHVCLYRSHGSLQSRTFPSQSLGIVLPHIYYPANIEQWALLRPDKWRSRTYLIYFVFSLAFSAINRLPPHITSHLSQVSPSILRQTKLTHLFKKQSPPCISSPSQPRSSHSPASHPEQRTN